MSFFDFSHSLALQRTAPCVTAPASAAAVPPAMQVPRRIPRSLSLGSLAVAMRFASQIVALFIASFAGNRALCQTGLKSHVPAQTGILDVDRLRRSSTGTWSDSKLPFRMTNTTSAEIFSEAAAQKAAEESLLGESVRHAVWNKRFQQLLIPAVNLRDAAFDSAIEYLRGQAEQRAVGGQKINIVMLMPSAIASDRQVTIALQAIPFLEAVRYVCDLAGAEFTIDPSAIVVAEKGAAKPKKNDPDMHQLQPQLAEIFIPTVRLESASLDESLEFLKRQVVGLTNGSVNVNFVDTVRSAQPEKISLRLEGVSFFDVLGYVCELSHSTFSVPRHAIVISSTRIPDRERKASRH